MHKLIWKSLCVTPAVLGATLVAADASIALESQSSLEIAPPEVAELEISTDANFQVQALEIVATPNAPERIESEPVFSATESTLDVVEFAPATPLAQVPPANVNNSGESQLLEQINRYGSEGNGNSFNQVTNVNQLRDVSPGDWAYEALRNLVETYGCIAGYPDGTYRGNRAMTRYEFAAGLNACLQQIERLIAASTADFVTRDDLVILQRLLGEFEAELATLGTRVDNLEGRVAFLEDHQFSTTTKLVGEVIFAGTGNFGDDVDSDQIAFGNRIRLVFDTSFTGTDSLVTRLNAGNLDAFGANGSFEDTQTFNLGANGNNIDVDWLAYYNQIDLPLVGRVQGYVAATGGLWYDFVPTLNPFFEDFDGGNGAISTFATENPIYRIGGGAGIGGSFQFGLLEGVLGPSTITAGYFGGTDANDPTDGNGLFNGDYAALAQINFNLSDAIAVGATYVHAYQGADTAIFGAGGSSGLAGTSFANLVNGSPGVGDAFEDGKVTNSYGGELTWRIGDAINFSGFFTYTDVIAINEGDGEIWTWGAGLAFPDFLREGSVLGLFGGVQPYLALDAGGVDTGEPDNPWHVEAFYKYQVSDNISFTPGFIWQINPNQSDDNDDNFIGTLRTTFTF